MRLEIRNLTVVYDGKPAIHNITMTLRGGVLTGVVGPNGAGKTTLLKAILGLVPRASG